MSWITAPFAWLLKALYELTGSYGWAVILFGVVVNLILLPFMAKSKKSMMKMSRISPQVKLLELKYGDDKESYQKAVQKLYKDENVSMTGGCLWSFIPMLIGTGCGIPGVMASRTIENERDRRMTIMTTCFIPCGAKMPIIGLIAGALFGGSSLVAVSAYFIGMAAIICSGIMLKKTKMFAGEPAPFVMELPAYHMPTPSNVLRSMWERGWSFIKKAGTIILLSTIVVWFTTYFGFTEDGFRMLSEDELSSSILAKVGNAIAWIFMPLGWGNWQATVASITGLVAKENIVGTLGILYGGGDGSVYDAMAAAFTGITAYSFLVFNLLCAPCFAAMGAIKREMNNGKWTAIAIGYMCALAYCAALVVYQLGGLITGEIGFNFFTIVAAVVLVAFIYLMVRPNKYAGNNEVKIDVTKI